MTAETDRADREESLRAACDSVTALIDSSHGPLRRMRVRAGGVDVEVEWPDDAPRAAGTPAPAPGPQEVSADLAEPDGSTLHHLCAPGVGTFYSAPEPCSDPFVVPGDRVEPGRRVGILEVMKLLIPIEADAAGQVAEILVENGQSVEFGQVLMSFEPG